jgi:ariadne-2
MKSQGSDDSDYDNNSEEDMDDYNYYYNIDNNDDTEGDNTLEDDPEFFAYELLSVEDVERLLNENVEALCKSIGVSFLF